MDKRLKKIIFKKLYEDLSRVEMIQRDDSIWFIDRDEKYWYFEYFQNKILYWRYEFFNNFFNLFSIEKDEYEQIISDWVEEVLNSKVVTPSGNENGPSWRVEEVLNYKVVTPVSSKGFDVIDVEKVLKGNVSYKVWG